MSRATLNYLLQRSTAGLLVPLALWVMFFVIPTIIPGILLSKKEVMEIFFQSKINVISLVIFIVIGLYHGFLGMASIFKDYIACDMIRKIVTLIFVFCTIFTIFTGAIMIIDQHIITLIR